MVPYGGQQKSLTEENGFNLTFLLLMGFIPLDLKHVWAKDMFGLAC